MADNCHLSRLSRLPPPHRDRKTQQTVGVSRLSRLSRRAHTQMRACVSLFSYLPGQVGQMGQTAVARGFALSRYASVTGTDRDSLHG